MSEDHSGKVGLDARPSFPALRRIDAAWYRVEKWVCGVMFLAMALMMFALVVRDNFQTRWFPIDDTSAADGALVGHLDVAAIAIDALVLFGLVLLGVFTRVVKPDEKPKGAAVKVAIAAGISVTVVGLVALYVNLLPEGFLWAPKMALCIMLWVGFLGASMATFDKSHLALEIGEKIWPARWQRAIKTFAHGLTTAFCLCLFILMMDSILEHHHGWAQEDGRTGTVPTLPWLPNWVVFLVLPYAFLAMAVRFGAQAVTTANGTAVAGEAVVK